MEMARFAGHSVPQVKAVCWSCVVHTLPGPRRQVPTSRAFISARFMSWQPCSGTISPVENDLSVVLSSVNKYASPTSPSLGFFSPILPFDSKLLGLFFLTQELMQLLFLFLFSVDSIPKQIASSFVFTP